MSQSSSSTQVYRQGELDFIPQQEYFKKNYQVILPDLKGHGQSVSEQIDVGNFFHDSAVDLAETLKKLQIDRAHIVGASLGALVGLVFAKRYPDKARSLTLSGIIAEKLANWEELQAEVVKMQLELLMNEEAVQYFDGIYQTDWKAFLKQSHSLDWYPFRETGDVSTIQCPALAIVGEGKSMK